MKTWLLSLKLVICLLNVAPPARVHLEIEPRRGIIMQKELKVVRVWVRDEDRDQALSEGWEGQSVKISMTMRA